LKRSKRSWHSEVSSYKHLKTSSQQHIVIEVHVTKNSLHSPGMSQLWRKFSFSFHKCSLFSAYCVFSNKSFLEETRSSSCTNSRILIRNWASQAALNIHAAWSKVQDVKGVLSAANYRLILALGNFHFKHHRAENLLQTEVTVLLLLPAQNKRWLPTTTRKPQTNHINWNVIVHDFITKSLIFNGKYPVPAGIRPRGREFRLLLCDWFFNWLFRAIRWAEWKINAWNEQWDENKIRTSTKRQAVGPQHWLESSLYP